MVFIRNCNVFGSSFDKIDSEVNDLLVPDSNNIVLTNSSYSNSNFEL